MINATLKIFLLVFVGVAFSGCAIEDTMLGKIGEDNATYQKGYREGYLAGQADVAKREYWTTVDRFRWDEPKSDKKQGRTTFYTVPTEGTTIDGRKLEGGTVTVPIVEP